MPYAGFSVLQQYMVDDLLPVAIDTRHHGSHHKIVFEGKLFLRSVWERSQLLLAAEIMVLWKQENRIVGH